MAIKINLMPDAAGQRQAAMGARQPIYLLIIFIIFLVCALAALGLFVYKNLFLGKQLVDAKNKNIELQGNISDVLNSKDSNLIINSVVKGKSVKTILASHPYTTNIYAFLEGVTIKNVSYNKLSLAIKDKASVGVTIAGTADSYKALAKQLISLKRTKEVKKIIFKEAAENKDGRVGFTMELLLDSSLVFSDFK